MLIEVVLSKTAVFLLSCGTESLSRLSAVTGRFLKLRTKSFLSSNNSENLGFSRGFGSGAKGVIALASPLRLT